MMRRTFFEEPAMILPDFLTRDADDEIHLTGHRIGLYTVVRLYREGNTAEQLAEELESLELALVYKVLAFYLENRTEVDAYVDAYRAELERQEQTYQQGPNIEELRRRWQAKGLGSLP
jgi:uncharacterized protein (DUF433 family)